MPSEREIRKLYVNGLTICIESFLLPISNFQRPQDAQPSPQVTILGAWGIIPQQAFWRVENPPKSQTCTCLHCLPVCEYGFEVK